MTFALPDPGPSLDAVIGAILDGLKRQGVAIVFGTMFLDCLPFAAFVAPGVIMLVLAGFFAASQSVEAAVWLYAAACAGVVACDTFMYAIGRTGYSRSRAVKRFVDKRDKLRRALVAQPAAVLIAYQFPPYSRMFAPLILGALEVTWARWTILVSVSTLLFVTSFFSLGLWAGLRGQVAGQATQAASVVSFLFVLGFLVWLARLVLRLARRPRGHQP